MRKEPNLKSEIIDVIPYDSRIKVMEESDSEVIISGVKGKWCKVEWRGKIGWAFGGYLKSFLDFDKEFERYRYSWRVPVEKDIIGLRANNEYLFYAAVNGDIFIIDKKIF
ncbi:MAG: SH3 domain-containing protein [Spirochaetia bacterium]